MLGLLFGMAIAAFASVLLAHELKKRSAKPVTSPNKDKQDAYFREISFSSTGAESFSRSSPHLMALQWLAYQDSLWLRPASERLRQRYALSVIYFSTGGETWNVNGWNRDSGVGLDECNWSLVACSNGIVVGIAVTNEAIIMSGSLPSEIGMLSSLETLELGGNRLNGELPNELFLLTNLGTS